jgi:hypothetical protein
MKKHILCVFWCFCSVSILLAQHKRRVLVEEFTQASCAPCADNNPQLNATLQANAGFVTPIKYQTSFPGTDPMHYQTAADVNPRVSYYNVPGAPDLIENGKRFQQVVGTYSSSRIQSAYNNSTPVTLQLTHRLNAAFDSVLITVQVKSDNALSGDLRLHIAVTEAEIKFSNPPGSNGETQFFNIMRKLLPDANGISTGSFAAGQQKTYQLKWAIQNFYDLNQLEVVAWLQNRNTKEVFQSERSRPNTSVPGGNFGRILLGTNVAQQLICSPNFTPTFILRNIATTKMTTAKIAYGIDNAPAQVFEWQGELNSNATKTLQLPAVTFDKPGFHVIWLRLQETNHGKIINLVEASEQIQVNSFFESSTPLVNNNFENTPFPPEGWGLRNERSGIGFSLFNGGGANNSQFSVLHNFFDLPTGRSAEIILPECNLNTLAAWQLSFEHAYCQYEDIPNGILPSNDRLRVDVSINCGTAWTTVFDKAGSMLKTAAARSTTYTPLAGEWVSNEIDLSAWKGRENVLIRFRTTSDYGNNLYLDNIRMLPDISSAPEVGTITDLRLTPNPTAQNSTLYFTLARSGDVQISVTDVLGNTVISSAKEHLVSGVHQKELSLKEMPPGVYFVRIQQGNSHKTLRLVLSI